MAEAGGEGVQRRGTVLSVCFMATCGEQGRPSAGTWSERPRAGEPHRPSSSGVTGAGEGGVTRLTRTPPSRWPFSRPWVRLLAPSHRPVGPLPLASSTQDALAVLARILQEPPGAVAGERVCLSACSCVFTLVSCLVVDWAQEAVPGQKACPPGAWKAWPRRTPRRAGLHSAFPSWRVLRGPGRRALFPMRRCLRVGPSIAWRTWKLTSGEVP